MAPTRSCLAMGKIPSNVLPTERPMYWRINKRTGIDWPASTFTIDADGVLQDEHIGDASIEGELKKLVNRARELQTTAKRTQ
jgi:hypothetical protein